VRPAPHTSLVLLSALATLSGVLVLTSPPGAAAESAQAVATPTVTKTSHEIDVHVGPAGAQTCTIVYDLYTPSTATAATPAPAILTTNGFGGSKDDQADLGQAFAERGYVVLSYSGLGFGGSDCQISLDDPDYDGKAAQQLVTYLGGGLAANDGSRVDDVERDATAHDGKAMANDPRVGMIGGSYGGQVQFAVAGIDLRVDAIVPIITWNDLAYSLAPNNTDMSDPAGHGVTYATPGTEKVGWTSLFFGVGIADGIEFASIDPTRNVGCPNFVAAACVAKAQMDAIGYPTDDTLAFARHASVSSYVKNIRVPTLLMQGENDTLFNLQEAVATYEALQAQGTETKMIWQSWGHSGATPAPGELDMRHPEQSYEGQRVISWFERYLQDKPVDTGPEFSFFRDWGPYSGIATPAYGSSATYPAGSSQQLYLSGSDRLVTSRSTVVPGSATYANLAGEAPLSYSEVSAVQGDPIPNDETAPYDAPGSFAAWSTAPLAAPVDSVGAPHLTLHLSSPLAAAGQSAGPAGHLLLFAKIYDVAPDGSTTLVNRLISPTRVADVTQPVEIELPGVVHRYAAGHVLRVVVSATDAAYRNNAVVQPVTVLTSPTAPGVLSLPVIGGTVG
jgi:X-Pro dipeptidyl-peptidase (S15 family)/X-Pro dipeptidyl-peptidase C-terminal non-catalytic domain